MKRIFKILLITLFVFAGLNVVNAISGKYDNTGKITITNAEVGQSYSIYQILKLDSYNTDKNAYIYKIDKESKWYEFLTTDGKDYVNIDNETNIVTWVEGKDATEFSKKAIKFAKDKGIEPTRTSTAKDKTLEFKDLYLGYYLLDSSLGSLCNLTTTNKDVRVKEKNGITTINKEVQEDSTKEYGIYNKAQIGDTVSFKTTINVAAGSHKYMLYDKMDKGLTFIPSSIKIILTRTDNKDKVLTINKDYQINEENKEYTFIIDFSDDCEEELLKDDKLIVTYDAILNDEAVINGTGNKNETYLKYGDNSKTNISETRTYTFKFNMIKTDNKGEELSGAEFLLYDSKKDGNKIDLVKVEENIYRVATKEEREKEDFISVVIDTSRATIIGLDDDSSYFLEEVTSPDGYNKLTSRVEVKLNATIDNLKNSNVNVTGEESILIKYEVDNIVIINLTNALLPKTGGVGTTLFMVIGSSLVLIFGLLLYTKIRLLKLNNKN